jgi:dimeric dUTPase (all-alpha-NTP-PPase superfamily)
LWLMADVSELYHSLCNNTYSKFDYEFLLLRFIHLGEMLGFTWEEVEEAYLRKNAVNHQRQNSGY